MEYLFNIHIKAGEKYMEITDKRTTIVWSNGIKASHSLLDSSIIKLLKIIDGEKVEVIEQDVFTKELNKFKEIANNL